MKTRKKSFLIYHDNCEWLEQLDYEQLGRLFSALYHYADLIRRELITPMEFMEQGLAELPGEVIYPFGFMADNIYRDTVKWNAAVEKRLQRAAREKEESA